MALSPELLAFSPAYAELPESRTQVEGDYLIE
jgi:hypothetical protein